MGKVLYNVYPLGQSNSYIQLLFAQTTQQDDNIFSSTFLPLDIRKCNILSISRSDWIYIQLKV